METRKLKELASRVLSKSSGREETPQKHGNSVSLKFSLKGNSKSIDIHEENNESFQFPGYGGNRETAPLSLPYFHLDGGLVIPFGCDPKYHHWAGGMKISKTDEKIRNWKH